jgi:hypothetical protein
MPSTTARILTATMWHHGLRKEIGVHGISSPESTEAAEGEICEVAHSTHTQSVSLHMPHLMDPAIVSHKIKQQVSEKMVNLAIDSTLLTIKHAGGTGLDNNVSSLTPTLISTPSLSPTSSHHSRTPFTARIERTLT